MRKGLGTVLYPLARDGVEMARDTVKARPIGSGGITKYNLTIWKIGC